MKNKLDIEAWKTSLNASIDTGYITSEDFEGFMQALEELEIARQQLDYDMKVIKDRDDAITHRDKRIVELEEEMDIDNQIGDLSDLG